MRWDKRRCRYPGPIGAPRAIFLFPRNFICAISLNMCRSLYRKFFSLFLSLLPSLLPHLSSLSLPVGHGMKALMLHSDANFVSDFHQSRSRVTHDANGRGDSELMDWTKSAARNDHTEVDFSPAIFFPGTSVLFGSRAIIKCSKRFTKEDEENYSSRLIFKIHFGFARNFIWIFAKKISHHVFWRILVKPNLTSR